MAGIEGIAAIAELDVLEGGARGIDVERFPASFRGRGRAVRVRVAAGRIIGRGGKDDRRGRRADRREHAVNVEVPADRQFDHGAGHDGEIAAGADFIPLIQPDDAAGFAREIDRFRNMSAVERAQIGEKCRVIAVERFSLAAMHNGYDSVYGQVRDRQPVEAAYHAN